MSIINITCKCGRNIVVDVKTIDTLRAEINRLQIKLDNCNARLSALELRNKTINDDAFNSFIRGFK